MTWPAVITSSMTGSCCSSGMKQDRVDGERGAIVTLSSVEGLEGTAGGSAYDASKGGVVPLTKNAAIDYGPNGIRVNAMCPGFIETPLFELIGLGEQ